MKKISAIILALCLFILSNCSSDDPVPVDETPEIYLKFFANNQQFIFEPETFTSLQKLINGYIFANDSITRVSLWMPVSPSVGTHQLQNVSATTTNIDTLYSASFWLEDDVFVATTGSITISDIDTDYIKGTFSFTGTSSDGATITISNGTFIAYN